MAAFAGLFLDSYVRANRQKPSTIVTKEVLIRVHLKPLLGAKRLDAITTEDVQILKHALSAKAPKTVNNVISVLSTLLKTAVEWGVIDRVPLHNPDAQGAKVASGVPRLRDLRAFGDGRPCHRWR